MYLLCVGLISSGYILRNIFPDSLASYAVWGLWTLLSRMFGLATEYTFINGTSRECHFSFSKESLTIAY